MLLRRALSAYERADLDEWKRLIDAFFDLLTRTLLIRAGGQGRSDKLAQALSGGISLALKGSTPSAIAKSTIRPLRRSTSTVPTAVPASTSRVTSAALITSPPKPLGKKVLKKLPTK